MTSEEDLSRFITSSFPSVWALELLLMLKGREGRHSHEELVVWLRASDLVVTQALNSLIAAGLASVDEDQCASYTPVSAAVADLVKRTADLYSRRPDAVRRMIVAPHARGITAFADAFRLRKD